MPMVMGDLSIWGTGTAQPVSRSHFMLLSPSHLPAEEQHTGSKEVLTRACKVLRGSELFYSRSVHADVTGKYEIGQSFAICISSLV